MQMPGRKFNEGDYRYGFNGKENDNEIKGDGNHVDFGARGYDPQLGRWFAVDPLAHEMPSWSPYSYSFNNPIFFIDPDGMKPTPSQAAAMAQHIYDAKIGQVIEGWVLTKVYLNDNNPGYKAGVYEREVDGVMEYTMVNMGTIPGTKDSNKDSMLDNIKQMTGDSPHMKLSLDQARTLSSSLGEDADLTYIVPARKPHIFSKNQF